MNNVNKRIDQLTKETQELKCSLQFSQREIEDLTKNNERIELESKSARTDIKTMCETMIKITDKADYLEGQSKKNNVVVDGIPETQNESWKETEDKVRSVITEKLHLDCSRMEIERAHRTGNPSGYSGKRPRPAVIKFLRHKD